MKTVLVVSLVPLLIGCASLSYQEPTESPRARVRFSTNTVGITVLRGYDDSACIKNEKEWMRLRNGYLINSNPKSLNMPLWRHHLNAAKEVYVSTLTETYGMFIGTEMDGTTTYTCGVPFRFQFEDGHDYEVNFDRKPWNDCNVTISALTRKGDEWSLRELAKFDNRIGNQNKECMDQFNKLRLY